MIQTLKLISQHIIFFEELNESYSVSCYQDTQGIGYYVRTTYDNPHYMDVVHRNCLGHSLREAQYMLLKQMLQYDQRRCIVDKLIEDLGPHPVLGLPEEG